jgi:hypothetical protein
MISQPDIDRMGIDAFINNIIVNIQEDINGGRGHNQITDYYMSNYGIDVTFSINSMNIRLYTESEGWSQHSCEIAK